MAEVPSQPAPNSTIDETRLCELLGYSSRDEAHIGKDAFAKVLALETAINDARLVGRITRYAVTDRATGEVLRHVYVRDDVLRIMANKG